MQDEGYSTRSVTSISSNDAETVLTVQKSIGSEY